MDGGPGPTEIRVSEMPKLRESQLAPALSSRVQERLLDGAHRPQCEIQSVRELEGGARDLFLNLYGHDVSGAVLALLSDLSSPEYRKFLLECALPATLEQRDEPGADRQMLPFATS